MRSTVYSRQTILYCKKRIPQFWPGDHFSLNVTKGLLRRSGKSITEGPHTPDAPPQQAGETNGRTNN